MCEYNDEVKWYLPNTRAIIPLDNYNFPKSLKKFIESEPFEVHFDIQPERVIRECGKRKETWICEELIKGYKNLINLGYLHSVEVYKSGELAGGLYGISINGVFFGESMFTILPQSSKVALIKLIEHLNIKGFELLDVQIINDHLKMFGAIEVDFSAFGALLEKGISKKVSFI